MRSTPASASVAVMRSAIVIAIGSSFAGEELHGGQSGGAEPSNASWTRMVRVAPPDDPSPTENRTSGT
jgi:hypothetical protein